MRRFLNLKFKLISETFFIFIGSDRFFFLLWEISFPFSPFERVLALGPEEVYVVLEL